MINARCRRCRLFYRVIMACRRRRRSTVEEAIIPLCSMSHPHRRDTVAAIQHSAVTATSTLPRRRITIRRITIIIITTTIPRWEAAETLTSSENLPRGILFASHNIISTTLP